MEPESPCAIAVKNTWQQGGRMFCPECQREVEGGIQCPECGGTLEVAVPSVSRAANKPISYDALVELVRQGGGELEIDVSTTDVGTERTLGFPWRGYKFSWAKSMQGALDGTAVELATTEVGTKKTWGFPYFGYGYGWAKRMQGQVGGHAVSLAVVEVGKKKSMEFPWRGYGFAWAQELSGECGGQLEAHLSITDVGRAKGSHFPYFGYGAAWAKKGTLTLRVTGKT
jgi:hypothetical protein